MKELDNGFSTALRESRKSKKLTQAELAQKAGISLMSIRRYEAGDSFPDMGTLAMLCVALHDDDLLRAWGRQHRLQGEKSQEHFARMAASERLRDTLNLQFWEDLYQKGNWEFINLLVRTAKYYQQMDSNGIENAISFIRLLAKVPDFKAEKEWAFIEDDPKGEAKDGEESE